MPKIKITIVDDHPLIIQGIEKILSKYPGLEIITTYANAEDLLKGLKQQQPHVLLLDIQLPDIHGDELVPELMDNFKDLKIIVLTNFDSAIYASKMIWQGVHGYLLKTSGEDKLIEAIHTVFKGEKFVEASIEKKLAAVHTTKSPKFYKEKLALTTREKEILKLIVKGFTDKEVAEKVFLGHSTVKYYRANLFLKLDVKNTAELVSKALKTGLA